MNTNEKFEQITNKVISLNIDEQRKFLYLLLGATKSILDKPSINKSDILLTYDVVLTSFKGK